MKKAKNTVLKPKPLKLRKVVLDRPGHARRRPVHSHRHEFLLTDEEEVVFQTIVDDHAKHFNSPKGSARSETFRYFLECLDVKKVLYQRNQILSFGPVLHEKDAEIRKCEVKIVSLELRIDDLSEELVLCQAELMTLGKMELNSETIEHSKQILEMRKVSKERRVRPIHPVPAAPIEEQIQVAKQPLCGFCGNPWTPPEGVDASGFCDACLGEREAFRSVMFS